MFRHKGSVTAKPQIRVTRPSTVGVRVRPSWVPARVFLDIAHLYASICSLLNPENSRKLLTTAEVAVMAGIHRDTLLRWLRSGLVTEPRRDRHGWRLFTPADAERVVNFGKGGASDAVFAGEVVRAEPYSPTSRLRGIDWDFRDARTVYLTHGIHAYPAKFIPQIPNALIQELSSYGETVADIFCGSGTALVEALTLKRNAVGIDANPLACLISRAKTTEIDADEAAALHELAKRAQGMAGDLASGSAGLFRENSPFHSDAPRPEDNTLSFWFEPHVVEELAELLSWCKAMKTRAARTVALTCFSSIVVGVSKQDSDTRYVRRTKEIEHGGVFARFAKALLSAARAVQEFSELVEPGSSCSVKHADVLSAPRVGKVDLVVCSPPYPNAYSYHLYHRTRMLWLGMDNSTFKRVEIGSHRKYSSKSPNRSTPATFRNEMSRVFGWLKTTLRLGRYACFVVGDSVIRGERVCNADLLAEAAARHGFSDVDRITRHIPDARKTFNPAIGRIKEETILVLRNDGDSA